MQPSFNRCSYKLQSASRTEHAVISQKRFYMYYAKIFRIYSRLSILKLQILLNILVNKL